MGTHAVKPRPHQVDALNALTRAFGTGDRTQLIMPCGSGKSLVARWHTEASEAGLTVVLVPSLALVAQTIAEWRRAHHLWRFEALVVCSDPTTATGAAERAEDADDRTLSPTAPFWATQRTEVTTDHKVVMRFLTRTTHRPRVIFATYHSAPVITHAQAATRVFADLLICDEAHRLAGRPREEFRVALDARHLLARRRLFMTATPLAADPAGEEADRAADRSAGLGLDPSAHATDCGDDAMVSMDDTALFGPVAHTVTFADAIERGLLCDYQVLVVADRSTDPVPNPETATPAALLAAVREHGVTRALTYHGRVAKAQAFADTVDGTPVGDGRTIRARCIHGRLKTAERRKILHWLGAECASEVRVVTNAKCLVEGVDVPAVDAVLFADPRESVVDVVQAVGRVLRPAPGKTRGSIVIPVSLPADEDDTELTLSQFGTVYAVVRGLRAHDERLADDLDLARRQAARDEWAEPGTRTGHQVGAVTFVLPDGLDVHPLRLRLLERTSSGWERCFGLLEAYAWRTSGKLLSRSHVENGVAIGEWAERQRIAHRKGRLPAARRRRLEDVPGWVWDRAEGVWQASYSILAAFTDVHGSVTEHEYGTSVFDGILDAEHRPLGRWLARQRAAHRAGTLPAHQATALEALPGWTWTPVPADDLAMVDALACFTEWEKHADVPDSHVEDGLKLGAWCRLMRRRKLTGRLHPALADEIAVATPPRDGRSKAASVFLWKVDETQWRLAFTALRQFVAREGHAVVPSGHREQLPDATINLGTWVAKQRHDQRRGNLEDRYAAQLVKQPGWVWEGTRRRAYEEPLDLGTRRHGTAGAAAAGCKCEPCMEYSRERTRVWQAKRRQLPDGVPAGPARAHVEKVLDDVATRFRDSGSDQRPPGSDVVAIAARVPVGMLRTVMRGRTDVIRDQYAVQLLAVTAEDVMALFDTAGSRGRLVMRGSEKVPADPTRLLLAELYTAGWTPIWVAAQLGYDRKVQISGTQVTLRVAEAVADLHRQVAGRAAPSGFGRHQQPPDLATLEADGLLPPTTEPATGPTDGTSAAA